jgi:hypothetical protein
MTSIWHSTRRIGRSGAGAFAISRAPALRIFLGMLGLLALMIQTLVVQTHVHYSAATARAQIGAISVLGQEIAGLTGQGTDGTTPVSRDRLPINDDPSNCPLCQAFTHFSQFIHGLAVFSAPILAVTTHHISLEEALPSFAAASHNWRGRAPPV